MANILIIKLGALGDVVMSTSLIKQIQAFHSADDLFLLTSRPFAEVFRNWQGLTIHAPERKGIYNGVCTIGWIRKNRFVSVYDLQSNDRTGLYCALSGIAIRIGNHPRYPYSLHPDDVYKGQCHSYTRLLAVLASAGIPAKPGTPTLPASRNEKERIKDWLYDNKLTNKNFIIVHAGGSKQHPEKRWPHFEKLATTFLAMSKAVVWVGGDDDLETNESLSSITGINACNLFNFSELAELGNYASFAITNDSGPMHILSCSMIPVYGLFGPTNWRRAHALEQQHRVITPAADIISQDNVFVPRPLDTLSIDNVLKRLKNDGLI